MGIKISGCALVTVTPRFISKYGVSDIVYFCPRARKGKLEAIAVKEVMLRFPQGNWLSPIYIYKDTLNAYFNENELCTLLEAQSLIDDYAAAKLQHQIDELKKAACFIPAT